MGIECCRDAGRDESCCDTNTVEGDMVREACDDVTDVVTRIRESVDTSEDGSSRDRDITTLTIFVGELARAVVQYDDPEAGLEPLE